MAKVKVNPALLIEHAVRAKTMERAGVEFQGRIHSSDELRKLSGAPIFPLPPFNEKQYYMNKNGSSSSNSD